MSEAVKMYNKKSDWFQELERCNATGGWRVYSKDCRVSSSSLPMHFVVPKHLSDVDYDNISKSFRNNRSAIWVSGHERSLCTCQYYDYSFLYFSLDFFVGLGS